MISPTRRRKTVGRVRANLSHVSERRACAVVGQPRSTHRYQTRPRDEEQVLVKRMLELVAAHPRYGYRRITRLLRDEGWKVNRKRIYRLWRQEGLKVPKKQRKKRRLGSSANGVVRRRPEHANHVWCWDFVKDQTTDGRSLKFLVIEDEFTRECLALEGARSMTAPDVLEVLKFLVEVRGAPEHIRSDNGPEFIAHAIRRWLEEAGVATLYIEPGAPWENAYCESFNSRLRDELLDRELFGSLQEAKVLAEDYRLEYNHHRPHSSLDYLTPAAFAAKAAEGTKLRLAALASASCPQQPQEDELTLTASGT